MVSYERFPIDMATYTAWPAWLLRYDRHDEQRSWRHEWLFCTLVTPNDVPELIWKCMYYWLTKEVTAFCRSTFKLGRISDFKLSRAVSRCWATWATWATQADHGLWIAWARLLSLLPGKQFVSRQCCEQWLLLQFVSITIWAHYREPFLRWKYCIHTLYRLFYTRTK